MEKSSEAPNPGLEEVGEAEEGDLERLAIREYHQMKENNLAQARQLSP